MRFRTSVELGGKTATGFEVPRDIVEALGSRKRPPVRVAINGHSYRSTVAPFGDRFLIPLSAENRTSAGVAAGDEIDVDIEVDTEPREVSVPADFAAALEGVPEARRLFEGLSYSRQRGLVMNIEGAKQAETRERRIATAVNRLSEGRSDR